MSNKVKKFIAALVVLGGFGLMVYPFIANYLFENRQDSIINTYESTALSLEEIEREQMRLDAEEYNEALVNSHVQLTDPFAEDLGEDTEEYDALLNLDGTGVMSYISIPCINVNLPIYHGTSSEVLEKGVGHLEGSSLPIGGTSTHCVLTGHTGLSSAKLFTDLTQLEEGDIFIITTLGEKLAYEVDQIKVVEPSDTSDLSIVEGEDYVTLVTCTPYGVNSHRLLVRGHRVEYTEEYEDTSVVASKAGDSEWMRQYRISLYVAIAFIVIVLFLSWLAGKRRKKHEEN